MWACSSTTLGPTKAAPLWAQVDALVSEGRLLPFGYIDGTSGRPMGSQIVRSERNRKVRVTSRPETCSIRAYKQRLDYPSIPDRGGSPRSFLAPYDHSTSSGSSTGDPETATSD